MKRNETNKLKRKRVIIRNPEKYYISLRYTFIIQIDIHIGFKKKNTQRKVMKPELKGKFRGKERLLRPEEKRMSKNEIVEK